MRPRGESRAKINISNYLSDWFAWPCPKNPNWLSRSAHIGWFSVVTLSPWSLVKKKTWAERRSCCRGHTRHLGVLSHGGRGIAGADRHKPRNNWAFSTPLQPGDLTHFCLDLFDETTGPRRHSVSREKERSMKYTAALATTLLFAATSAHAVTITIGYELPSISLASSHRSDKPSTPPTVRWQSIPLEPILGRSVQLDGHPPQRISSATSSPMLVTPAWWIRSASTSHGPISPHRLGSSQSRTTWRLTSGHSPLTDGRSTSRPTSIRAISSSASKFISTVGRSSLIAPPVKATSAHGTLHLEHPTASRSSMAL